MEEYYHSSIYYNMFCAKLGSGQSMDYPAQSVDWVDPRFAQTVHGLLAQSVDSNCAKHDNPMDGTVEHAREPWRQHAAFTVSAKGQ